MKNQPIFLILIAGALVFMLAACQQSSGDPLDGTAWTLVSLNGETPISENTPTAEFIDGQVGGSSGCNSYGGKYEVDDNKIAISEVVSTLMACTEPEGVMDQEGEFLSALSNAQSFNINGNQLEIATSDGATLIFSR